MGGRIPHTESLRVPEPGSSAPGQPAPKPRPRGVGDGKRVKIPVPDQVRSTVRGDAEAEEPSGVGVPMQRSSLEGGEKTLLEVRPDAECRVFEPLPRAPEASRQEKPRAGASGPTVPQTDTGRRGEKPKVLE